LVTGEHYLRFLLV